MQRHERSILAIYLWWVWCTRGSTSCFFFNIMIRISLACSREKKIYFKTERVNCKEIPPYSDIKIKLNQCKTRYVNIKKKVQINFNIKLQ
jgi:hypothetical protein